MLACDECTTSRDSLVDNLAAFYRSYQETDDWGRLKSIEAEMGILQEALKNKEKTSLALSHLDEETLLAAYKTQMETF